MYTCIHTYIEFCGCRIFPSLFIVREKKIAGPSVKAVSWTHSPQKDVLPLPSACGLLMAGLLSSCPHVQPDVRQRQPCRQTGTSEGHWRPWSHSPAYPHSSRIPGASFPRLTGAQTHRHACKQASSREGTFINWDTHKDFDTLHIYWLWQEFPQENAACFCGIFVTIDWCDVASERSAEYKIHINEVRNKLM